MGTQKKEKQRRVRENDTRDGNLRVKGENFYRDAKKVKHLNMYKQGRAIRNKKGNYKSCRFAKYRYTQCSY